MESNNSLLLIAVLLSGFDDTDSTASTRDTDTNEQKGMSDGELRQVNVAT
jgi:hypothetical protein